MDGILIVDKPEGLTSADVVRIAKRALRVKVGHLGTLDPFATGVLPLCLGDGTKIAQFLSVADKSYRGVIRLGADTDTGDKTGRIVREAPVPALVADELDALARRLCGEQLQTPPMYSAIKRAGVPLYKLARRGQDVARTPRAVSISALSLRATSADTLAFEVHCSKGTYVRVLAQDIGAALGTAAHLSALRRTVFGAFTLAEAVGIDDLKAGRVGGVIDLRAALGHLREVAVGAAIAQRARNGQASALRALPAAIAVGLAKLIDPDGTLVAIVSADGTLRWRFERVFGVASPPPQSIAP